MVRATVLPAQEAGQFPELVIRRYEHSNSSASVRKGLRLTQSISVFLAERRCLLLNYMEYSSTTILQDRRRWSLSQSLILMVYVDVISVEHAKRQWRLRWIVLQWCWHPLSWGRRTLLFLQLTSSLWGRNTPLHAESAFGVGELVCRPGRRDEGGEGVLCRERERERADQPTSVFSEKLPVLS